MPWKVLLMRLMSNITNQITNDPSRNAFVAEYSFLIYHNLIITST